MSKSNAFPHGLANSHGNVGKYLMFDNGGYAIPFRHDAPEAGMGEPGRKQIDNRIGLQESRRKSIVGVDLMKGFITNAATRLRFSWMGSANKHLHRPHIGMRQSVFTM
jgi:hypothetical protein